MLWCEFYTKAFSCCMRYYKEDTSLHEIFNISWILLIWDAHARTHTRDMYTYVCSCTCTCAYTHVRFWFFSVPFHPIFWHRVFHWAWSPFTGTACLAPKVHGSAASEPRAFNTNDKLFWNCVWHGCVQMSSTTLGGWRVGSSGAGASCACEPCDVHVRSWPESSAELSHVSSLSASPFYIGYGDLISDLWAYPQALYQLRCLHGLPLCVLNNCRHRTRPHCQRTDFSVDSETPCAHLLSKASGWRCSDRSGWTMWMTV